MTDHRLTAFYTDHFDLPLPAGHRFPMSKYRLLRERLRAGPLASQLDLRVPPSATDCQLGRVHDAKYLNQLRSGQLTDVQQRRIGFPWSVAMVQRSRRSTGATLAAARTALLRGIAVNLAGGTHHAFPDHGQGYCVLNDVAVAIRTLQADALIQRAVVIDCDVHQGNGTAATFLSDASVFTFSAHGAKNFPFAKCRGDLDVALPDRTGDAVYLAMLQEVLDDRLPLDGADCVFYLAGADPYRGDRLGRLSLSKTGLAERDRRVMSTVRERGIPLVIVMAGGYASVIEDIVDIHVQTVSTAARLAHG